jgi:hypothetical protein
MGRSKPVILANRQFASRAAATEHFRDMRDRYMPGEEIGGEDGADLASLLQRHPKYTEKVGDGIHHFEVAVADFSSVCFRVIRTDGTWANFSLHTCISPESHIE